MLARMCLSFVEIFAANWWVFPRRKNVGACGVIKQVTRFKRGFYINMKFPN